MAADRDEIVSFCDGLLDAGAFADYGPNGLQVPGGRSVDYLVSGVSAHRGLIEAAVGGEGTGMLLAHHGLFWDFHPRALSEQMAGRLRLALEAGLSVAAWHLPLDAHPEIGNNALLCAHLGLEPAGRFAEAKGRQIGIVGRARDGIPAAELLARLTALLEREPLVQGAGPDRIERIGIVSGAGASFIGEAVALGLDALLTGEPAEHAMADAGEGELHFVAAGHYATETFGVRRLGELLAERFGVRHVFLDDPNPI